MNFIARSGADLQAARKVAAERFTAIAMQELPDGWEVRWRRSLSGRCHYKAKLIETPKPVTRKSLYIFLHEVGHAVLHEPLFAMHGRHALPAKHVCELQAEQFAHDKMREHGIAVPRSMTQRAKRYVGRKLYQARRRGMKRADPDAIRFAGEFAFRDWVRE
jgi:hypothetical protein